MLQLLLSVVDI